MKHLNFFGWSPDLAEQDRQSLRNVVQSLLGERKPSLFSFEGPTDLPTLDPQLGYRAFLEGFVPSFVANRLLKNASVQTLIESLPGVGVLGQALHLWEILDLEESSEILVEFRSLQGALDFFMTLTALQKIFPGGPVLKHLHRIHGLLNQAIFFLFKDENSAPDALEGFETQMAPHCTVKRIFVGKKAQ